MNLEERREKIKEMKQKYPEYDEMCLWYSICKATELCREDELSDTMDDNLTALLKNIEFEIEGLDHRADK